MDTILLVNDSMTLTKVLKSHFRKAGYQVFAVTTAMEAYQSFIRHNPNLILTDYVLSDKDGVTVVETFRSSPSHKDVPIVVFTAMEDPAIAARCKEVGTDLVLPKTSDFASILKAIEDLVEEHKSRQPSSSIDKDMGQCIVKSTVEVFKTMMNMKVVPGEISVEKAKPRASEVIASIGVAGFLSGSISVFMSRTVAETAARKMLFMEDEDEIGKEELIDATGELVNMVGGNIKTELFEKTPLFDISVPSVYIGQDLERRSVCDDLCFLVPFTYEGTEFTVEFLMVTREGQGTTGVQDSLVASMG